VFGPDWQRQIELVPAMALIFLSLVLVSGYAGQISLCQASLAGFGAFVAAHLVADQRMSLFLAAAIAGLATVPLGAILAWRATRLPPLFLGLATLAFAALMDQAVLTNQRFAHGLVGIPFHRPHLVSGDRAYYLFTLAVFALAALLATNLRRGRNGLALMAMRDSPVGLASVGASVVRLKLVSFCLSAFLAGAGGALFAGARGFANSADWLTPMSELFLALAVIGGISRWPGALLGAAFYELWPVVFHQPVFVHNVVFKAVFHGELEALLPVFFGLGAIGLAQNPNGVVEQTREGLADARARWRARTAAAPVPAIAADRVVDEPRRPLVARTRPLRAGTAGPERPSVIAGDGRPVVATKGRLYHRPTCALVDGKPVRIAGASRSRALTACPLCEPGPPTAARGRRTRT
jgi:branched-chain amino acid transport system permease protein